MDYNTFLILRDLIETGVCADMEKLERLGYAESGSATDIGLAAMEPYRVSRAVFMAAGMGSRAVPLTYDIPKGMIKVNGEAMIERQIRQLKQAGVDDIWLVTGYMHEGYAHLGREYSVDFICNPWYNSMNNIGTIYHARELFDRNLYLLTVDIYLEDNIFHKYEYRSWYTTPFAKGDTGEWCLALDEDDLITDVVIGGRDAYIMCGPSYTDAAYAAKLASYSVEYVADPACHFMYWEHIYVDHLGEMPMYANKQPNVASEFETLDELRQCDIAYANVTGNRHMAAMAASLRVDEKDIVAIQPAGRGLFTQRFAFRASGNDYLHIYYDEDVRTMQQPCLQEPPRYTKLSVHGSYIVKCPALYPVRDDIVAMEVLRGLHDCCNISADVRSEITANSRSLLQRLAEGMPITEGYAHLLASEQAAHSSVPEEEQVLLHGAFCPQNCLYAGENILLLEDGFGYMGDRLADVGFYCAVTGKDVAPVLEEYLGSKPSAVQVARCSIYAAAACLGLHMRYSALSRQGVDTVGDDVKYLELLGKYDAGKNENCG